MDTDWLESARSRRRAVLGHHVGDAAKKATEIPKTDDKGAGGVGNKTAGTTNEQTASEPRPPRFEFGAPEDFQLTQAMNQLKGQPAVASTKALSAQAKPEQ